jgi:hypothetical protein
MRKASASSDEQKRRHDVESEVAQLQNGGKMAEKVELI